MRLLSDKMDFSTTRTHRQNPMIALRILIYGGDTNTIFIAYIQLS